MEPGIRRFIITFRGARHLSISWARFIQSMPPPHFLDIHFNIILPSTPVLWSYWSIYCASGLVLQSSLKAILCLFQAHRRKPGKWQSWIYGRQTTQHPAGCNAVMRRDSNRDHASLDDTAIRTTNSPRFSHWLAVNLPHSGSVCINCGLQYEGSAPQQHKRLKNEQNKL